MLYAAIDIHKQAFQAAVFDPESGEVVEERFAKRTDARSLLAPPSRGISLIVAAAAPHGKRQPAEGDRYATPRTRSERQVERGRLGRSLYQLLREGSSHRELVERQPAP
jgi:hypothetical protein